MMIAKREIVQQPVYVDNRAAVEDAVATVKMNGVTPSPLDLTDLSLVKAVPKAAVGQAVDDPVCSNRLDIVRDKANSIYLSMEHMPETKIVTLFELTMRMGMIKPDVHKNVFVRNYNSSYIEVDLPLRPGAKYAVLTAANAESKPLCREYANLLQLQYKPFTDMHPVVRAFISYHRSTPRIQIPYAAKKYVWAGFTWSFTYKQAPPGAGKTWELTHDAVRLAREGNVFVIAPTNELVIEIARRLASTAVNCHVALSAQGMLAVDSPHVNYLGYQPLGTAMYHRSLSAAVKWQDFSSIYIMTPNKAMSTRYERKGIHVDVMLIDELPLVPMTTFLALMNRNPHLIVGYGDEIQGVPFQPARYNDSKHMYWSPVHYYRIRDTDAHIYLGDRTRMPPAFSATFLKIFYSFECTEFPGALFSPAVTTVVKLIQTPEKSQLFHDGGSPYRDLVAPMLLGPYGPEGLIITPYVGQKRHLELQTDMRVMTLTPAQGSQANYVHLDFVRKNMSLFLTNGKMVVAMSRFKKNLILTEVPYLPLPIFKSLTGYKLIETDSYKDNYAKFERMSKEALAEVSGSVPIYDRNGDYALKWYYFLLCLQYYIFKNSKVDVYNTMLGKIMRGDYYREEWACDPPAGYRRVKRPKHSFYAYTENGKEKVVPDDEPPTDPELSDCESYGDELDFME